MNKKIKFKISLIRFRNTNKCHYNPVKTKLGAEGG